MTDGVSGLASTDKVGQTARYLRVSVAQGTSEGFYVRLKGRAIETSRALVQVLDVEPVVAEVGTPSSELGLPAEVMVQLEGDVATSLPVIWDEGSYDAETAGSQTVSGTLSLIPGVSADESALVASVVVTLEEPPAPVLDRIVVTAPAKTTYVQGEELDLAGMKVEAVYDDGTSVDVTDDVEVSGYDAAVAGVQTLTVSYGELTATFQVTEAEPEPEPEPGEDTKPGGDDQQQPEPGDDEQPGEDVKPGDDQKPGSDDVKPGNDQQGTSDPDDQQGDKRPSDDVKPSDEKPAGPASDDVALPSAGEAADPTTSLLTFGLLATASAVAVRGARRER